MKKINRTTRLIAFAIGLVIFVIIVLMAISGNKAPKPVAAHYAEDTASDDNKVEALKTLTANLQDVENKNKQLSDQIAALNAQNAASLAQFKQSISDSMQQNLKQLQDQNTAQAQKLQEMVNQKSDSTSYDIQGDDGGTTANNFKWVSDISTVTPRGIAKTSGDDTVLVSTDNTTPPQKASTVDPVYTIPVNATLTGASLMTPLVGRIPIDGKLTSPYQFKLVLSRRNLTANGFPLPGVTGAVASGIASGDMLGSCARGTLTSITFVFGDGRISTTQTSDDDQNGLGYLSSMTGDPCIKGDFHTNAGVVLSADIALGAAQGYANAFSQSQIQPVSDGASFTSIIKNANTFAEGQAGSAGIQAAQTWWNQRVQNSFDYIYVPNVSNGHPMKVVLNITQQISIDYDDKARKVSYESATKNNNHELD